MRAVTTVTMSNTIPVFTIWYSARMDKETARSEFSDALEDYGFKHVGDVFGLIAGLLERLKEFF